MLKVAGYDVRSRVKNKKIFYEAKTATEICNELVGFLFEAGSVPSDSEAVKYCEAAAKIISSCPDKKAFWDEFESDTTLPDSDIATKSLKTKSDFRRYFETQITTRGKSPEEAVKSKFESSKAKAKAFFKLAKKLALKLGVSIPKGIDPVGDKGKPEVEAPQVTSDLYIVMHKGMKYPDEDRKSK